MPDPVALLQAARGRRAVPTRIDARRREGLDRRPARNAPRRRVRREQRFHLAVQLAIFADLNPVECLRAVERLGRRSCL